MEDRDPRGLPGSRGDDDVRGGGIGDVRRSDTHSAITLTRRPGEKGAEGSGIAAAEDLDQGGVVGAWAGNDLHGSVAVDVSGGHVDAATVGRFIGEEPPKPAGLGLSATGIEGPNQRGRPGPRCRQDVTVASGLTKDRDADTAIGPRRIGCELPEQAAVSAAEDFDLAAGAWSVRRRDDIVAAIAGDWAGGRLNPQTSPRN